MKHLYNGVCLLLSYTDVYYDQNFVNYQKNFKSWPFYEKSNLDNKIKYSNEFVKVTFLFW